jgi:23S rRNA (cytosine1962-C5)-methyltransferase
MVACAKENLALSGLGDAPVRYIVDDCRKFVEREIRRGNKYDAVIMDPPSYGRGPGGEVWKLEDAVCDFVALCEKVLSDDPLFFLINSYTTGLSALTMGYVLDVEIVAKHGGESSTAELALPVTQTKSYLPCGASARWVATKK